MGDRMSVDENENKDPKRKSHGNKRKIQSLCGDDDEDEEERDTQRTISRTQKTAGSRGIDMKSMNKGSPNSDSTTVEVFEGPQILRYNLIIMFQRKMKI